MLKLLAAQAAIALENTRLYRDLAEREAKIRRLVDSNIIGIVSWDFEGRIIEANDTFLRMLGFDHDDLVAGSVRWTDLIPTEWRDRAAQALQELKTTGTAQPFEREYLRKDGGRVPVLIGAASLEGNENQGVAFVLDLTERRRAEFEARESERRYRETQMELAHANRLATMKQLTASIAHEVNQPIATIVNAQAAPRWLNRDVPDLEEARQLLAKIASDGDRAGNVVSRIRDLVKKAPQRMEPLHINEAISGDRTQLQQVILNLILNAVQAMSEGGLALRELQISTQANRSDGVLVSVRDSGPALRPENLDRLFDRFYNTKSGGMEWDWRSAIQLWKDTVDAYGRPRTSRAALPSISRSLPLLNRLRRESRPRMKKRLDEFLLERCCSKCDGADFRSVRQPVILRAHNRASMFRVGAAHVRERRARSVADA